MVHNVYSIEKGYTGIKNWLRKKLGWSTFAFEVVICYLLLYNSNTVAYIPPTPHYRRHLHRPLAASATDHPSPSSSDDIEDRILKAVDFISRHIEVSAGIPVLTCDCIIVQDLSVRVVKRAF